jgi:hypothetical protein
MVAFVLLGLAALAAAQLQGFVRWHVDLARQRTEAVRLGQREIESLRAWSSLRAAPGATSYAAIESAIAADDAASAPGSNAAYRIVRRVDDDAFPGAKLASVTVEWTDRSGADQRLDIDSVIARSDPAWSGALSLGAGAGAPHGVRDRAPGIPAGAASIGGGRSALKTAAGSGTAFLLDDLSAEAVSRCSGVATTTATRDLAATDLVACATGRWLLVSGTVRFSSALPPSATEATDVPPPAQVSLVLAGGSYPALPDCSAEPMKTVRYTAADGLHLDAVPIDALPASLGLSSWADTGDRYLAYRCFVAPRSDGRWSGRTAVVPVGWTIGAGSGDRRICRYSADADNSGAIDANIEHPDAYVDVSAALPAQNFLVVRGDQACPSAGAGLAAGLGTVQHQP